jgi:hypothetical protein
MMKAGKQPLKSGELTPKDPEMPIDATIQVTY